MSSTWSTAIGGVHLNTCYGELGQSTTKNALIFRVGKSCVIYDPEKE